MVAALLAEARARGAALRLVGDRIRVEAPRGALAPPLRAALLARRDELLELLRREGESPSARLECAWSNALARAGDGFADAGRKPTPEELKGAAVLELRSENEVEPTFEPGNATLARELLPEVYRGELVARLGDDGRAHVGGSIDILDLDPRPYAGLALGRMRCAGCSDVMPEEAGGLCFACDLGVDRADFPTKLMPYALELRDRLGPAGARGVRLEKIRELARVRRPRRLEEYERGTLGRTPGGGREGR